MKKINIILLIIIVLITSGCSFSKDKEILNDDNIKEEFYLGHTFDSGRVIKLSFDVPYKNNTLMNAFENRILNFDDFINKLDYIDEYNDGGSRLYYYDKSSKIFGNDYFYVVVCNSMDSINDIYVSRYKETLSDKCMLKIDDNDDIRLDIKAGTLTNEGATIIITDNSMRENLYGEYYRNDYYKDGIFKEVPIITSENYAWNSIGYTKDKSNKLEFNINWKWLYGKLEKGKYRIVKDYVYPGEGVTHYITKEFIIE